MKKNEWFDNIKGEVDDRYEEIISTSKYGATLPPKQKSRENIEKFFKRVEWLEEMKYYVVDFEDQAILPFDTAKEAEEYMQEHLASDDFDEDGNFFRCSVVFGKVIHPKFKTTVELDEF